MGHSFEDAGGHEDHGTPHTKVRIGWSKRREQSSQEDRASWGTTRKLIIIFLGTRQEAKLIVRL